VLVLGVGYLEFIQEIGTQTNLEFLDLDTKTEQHNVVAGFEMICFALAAFLFVMYMCFEDACCHASVITEHGYLGFVLAIIVCAPWLKWFDGMVHVKQRHIEKILHCIFATIVIRIAQSMIAPHEVDSFFKHRNLDSPGFADKPKRTQRSGRIVSHLQTLMDEVVATEAGRLGRISSGAFDMLMLFCLMFVQVFTVVNPALYKVNIFIGIWWAVLLFILLGGEYRRICKVRVPKETMVGLVRSLISENEQHNLRYVLWSVSVATLMEVGGPAIEAMLAQEALQRGLLGAVEKAAIVDAFQKRGLNHKLRNQRLVRDLFLSCSGSDLTAVKNLIDSGGDFHNLFKLIYSDISSSRIRTDIKEHLKAEATKLRSQYTGPHKREGVKILSDVDDTLFSSEGHFPAGCDKSFPHHKVYPGVLELFEVLDKTLHPELPSCNLVFLSARPHLYKNVMEEGSYRRFRSLVLEEQRMHTFPTMLPGDRNRSVRGFLTGKCQGTKAWRRVGEYKYITFRNYAELYPEYDFIFCGDNGQGDLLAAQHMATGGEHLGGSSMKVPLKQSAQQEDPPNLLASLIHEVLPDEKVLAVEKDGDRGPAWKKEQEGRRIFFHRTYIGAAIQLYDKNMGLVSAEQLRFVAASAITDFTEDVMYHSSWQDKWRPYELKLRRDYDEAQQILRHAGLEPLPPFPSVGELVPRLAELAGTMADMSNEDEDQDEASALVP
jgi:hypothetical protein